MTLTIFHHQPCILQGGEGHKPPPLVSCSPSSTLRQVLALLAEHRLHRLHVLDERSRPVGIVTITDLLRLIVGPSELLEAYGPVSLTF
jgi:CBS domain-containing protein